MKPTTGIHHITAISAEPQGHLDFYTEVLGLRMVKLTVNFDDPSVYHTYFADYTGTPGTVLTFFPWTGIRRGRIGLHQVSATRFAAAPGTLDGWVDRLASRAVDFDAPVERFGERVLALRDPEGQPLTIVETERQRPDVVPYAGGDLSGEYALGGFEGVELLVPDTAPTADLLTGVMGYRELGREGNRLRYVTGDGAASQIIDLVEHPGGIVGRGGAGTVHHVAFRADDDEHQMELREALLDAGQNVTTVRDRSYFHSIYFREPNGVLFEIATDGPGFDIDEPIAELGRTLRLPPQYESMRGRIEAQLPQLRLPQASEV
jgi:glyoxalase family protein